MSHSIIATESEREMASLPTLGSSSLCRGILGFGVFFALATEIECMGDHKGHVAISVGVIAALVFIAYLEVRYPHLFLLERCQKIELIETGSPSSLMQRVERAMESYCLLEYVKGKRCERQEGVTDSWRLLAEKCLRLFSLFYSDCQEDCTHFMSQRGSDLERGGLNARDVNDLSQSEEVSLQMSGWFLRIGVAMLALTGSINEMTLVEENTLEKAPRHGVCSMGIIMMFTAAILYDIKHRIAAYGREEKIIFKKTDECNRGIRETIQSRMAFFSTVTTRDPLLGQGEEVGEEGSEERELARKIDQIYALLKNGNRARAHKELSQIAEKLKFGEIVIPLITSPGGEYALGHHSALVHNPLQSGQRQETGNTI